MSVGYRSGRLSSDTVEDWQKCRKIRLSSEILKILQPARWPIFSAMGTLLPPPRDQRDLQSTLNAFLKFFSSLRRSFEDFGCFWASSLFAYSSSVGPEYSIKFAFQANEDARSVPCSTALRANLLLYSYLDRKWSRQNQGINSDITLSMGINGTQLNDL